jgi:hypothetical protein
MTTRTRTAGRPPGKPPKPPPPDADGGAEPRPRGRPRNPPTEGLPPSPGVDASEVEQTAWQLRLIDAHLASASARDAAPLLVQRRKAVEAMRVAKAAAKEEGEGVMTVEEMSEAIVAAAGDRENGWPDALAEAVYDTLRERLGEGA